MKYLFLAAFLFVQPKDYSDELSNNLAVFAECTSVENKDTLKVYQCGSYTDYELFKMHFGFWTMSHNDIEQVISWHKQGDYYAAMISYKGRRYVVVYVPSHRAFAISLIPEEV